MDIRGKGGVQSHSARALEARRELVRSAPPRQQDLRQDVVEADREDRITLSSPRGELERADLQALRRLYQAGALNTPERIRHAAARLLSQG